jgi:hypothetical protein
MMRLPIDSVRRGAHGALATATTTILGLALLCTPEPAGATPWQAGLKGAQREAADTARAWGLGDVLAWRTDVVLTAVVAMVGALVLAVPIAHVYMLTKHRHEYDPGVPQTVLILPAVVAGIVIVVQGSLALAFSLVGVAATVRFRSNLKDTNDAVFIFFAIALGIAAGVRGLDLAFAMCVVFCATIFAVSKSCYCASHPAQRGRAAQPPVGAPPSGTAGAASGAALPAGSMRDDDDGHVFSPGSREGIIAVHAAPAERAESARPAVEARLAEETKKWQLAEVVPGDHGESILEYRVRFKKKLDPHAVLDSLNAAARPFGATVEYRESRVESGEGG